MRSVLIALGWGDYRIVRGIARYAAEHDWHLSTQMLFTPQVLGGWEGDGAIVSYDRRLAKLIVGLNMPCVDLTPVTMPIPVPRVLVDNEAVGQQAAEHLLGCGFRTFAFFGQKGVWASTVRGRAFAAALRARGVAEEGVFSLMTPADRLRNHWPEYEEAVHGLLTGLPRPVGIYCGQENLAAELVEVCASRGIRVPEEVAVLGTDNIEFVCECLRIPLSSIDTRQEELGYRAAERLQQYMAGTIGPDAEPLLVAPAGVVRRQSTDVVAVSHPGVSRALRHLREHFGEPLCLRDLEPIAGISYRGLQEAFKRVIGRGPGAELRRLRLRHAKRMLLDTDAKIDTIAHACGYSNSTNLGTALKRETNLSASAYREQHRVG